MNELSPLSRALFFIQKARVGAGNRIQKLKERKEKCQITEDVFSRCAVLENWLMFEIRHRVRQHPAYDWFSKVKGIGDLNVGRVIGPIDIREATTISKMWRFAGQGLDPETGRPDRRVKGGKKIKFNPILKSSCWNLAKSLIKAKSKYYKYYLEQKKKEQNKQTAAGRKIVPGGKLPIENGKHVETDEFISVAHVDYLAMRKMIKLFLSHLWVKWREAEGLPVSMPYAHDILGHSDYEDPDNFIEPGIQETPAQKASYHAE